MMVKVRGVVQKFDLLWLHSELQPELTVVLLNFQNEREQIMTTNVWLTQVSVVMLELIVLPVLLNVLSLELELNHILFPLSAE